MEDRDNHIAMCPQSVPVATVQPAYGSLIGSGLGDVLVETIPDNPGVLTPCAQFDEQSRPACRAALLIGGTAIALGVRSMASSDEVDCQEALVYANQELRQRYRRANDALPGLENDYLEQQALLKKAVDDSGFKTTPYRALLAELLRDDLKLSSAEVAAFEREHPDVEGGAVAAYRVHRNSPFFDQMLEVFRVGIEIRRTQATIDLIAEVWPLDTSEEAAAVFAQSGACEAWIEHRRAALEE